jgi:hypothetical protein
MAVRIIAPSDRGSNLNGSYAREVIRLGTRLHGVWRGYATVKAGVLAANLDIIVPSQQRGVADTATFVLDANTRIESIGFAPRGILTLGAATGKLKLAATLGAATAGIFVESAAAAANSLAIATAQTINNPSVTIGGSDLTFKIFATDGGAGGAAAASTVTATKDTIIDVEIGFWLPAPFPTRLQVGTSAPPVI